MHLPDFFIIGIIGGLSPGPITALMLGETFKYGRRKGLCVPLALALSNLIIATLAITILYIGSQIDSLINLVTSIGALVLIFMGLQEWKSSGGLNLKTAAHPFLKSFLLDLLNPHPYIFWFTILAPPIILQLKV